MILRRAVDQYLNQKLRDSSKAKLFSDRALDRKLANLKTEPRFHTQPFRHQKICFLLGLKRKAYFHMLDPGLGKTKVCLDLFRHLKRTGRAQRALVLVPLTLAVDGWREECRNHTPMVSFVGLDNMNQASRRMAVHGASRIVCMTYMGWLSLVCKRVTKVDKNGEPEDYRKLVIDEEVAAQLEAQFDFVVFDESDALGNHTSLIYKTCKRLADQANYAYCLSGTPFDKNPESLWSQFKALDNGETLGKTLGLFRAGFFTAKKRFWGKGFDYHFDQRKLGALRRRLRHNSIRFSEKECLDLPKSIGGITSDAGPIVRHVVFTEETRAYYNRLIDSLRESKGNFTLLDNVYMQMRQLTSGYLRVKDPEGERHTVEFKNNPKLDALVETLKEFPPDKKVIVFTEYKITGALVEKRLKAEKIKCCRMFSGTANKRRVFDQFKEDPKMRVMIGSRTVAKSVNPQRVCHHMILYETPSSPKERTQLERRLARTGQTHRPHFRDLVVRGTIDERILQSLVDGQDLFDRLLDGKEKLKKV